MAEDTNFASSTTSCRLASLCLEEQEDPYSFPYWRETSALGWTFAYIIYIIGSQKHKQYRGVPFAALVLNLAWEFAFSFVWIENQSRVQLIIHYVWLGFDVMLALQFLRFEWKNFCQYRTWYLLLAVTLSLFLFIFIVELSDYTGTYMAFGQNLIMSIMFVQDALTMESSRCGDDPWTTWIAGLLRLIGTAAASIGIFPLIYDSHQHSPEKKPQPLLPFFFVFCFIWDMYYVYLTLKLWSSSHRNTKTRKNN
mmetsp:Transcript_6987/g.9084  ORF Transcript_6987/g.9084 Transcript_6987/m.9084 type:complete len:252 (+) Transcript_6987:78-833(+)